MLRPALFLALAASMAACHQAPPPRGDLPPPTTVKTSPRPAMVLVHGGQGSPASRSDGPLAAARAGASRLEAGSDALEAAMAAVRVLEDDPRFNAGTGANVRLDGASIECEAAVMADDGTFGAIASLRDTKNPVDAARAVADSPHRLLAGEGANRFAFAWQLPRADLVTPGAREKLERHLDGVLSPEPGSEWAGYDLSRAWNFDTPFPGQGAEPAANDEPPAQAATRDTVGAVVRTADGRYAAALSTGGTTLALKGRVGDVPQAGAGLYAGPAGAVAATGKGEAILRELVAVRVYDLLAAGVPPRLAVRRVLREISSEEGVGVIAVSEQGYAAHATSQMAWGMVSGEEAVDGRNVVW